MFDKSFYKGQTKHITMIPSLNISQQYATVKLLRLFYYLYGNTAV